MIKQATKINGIELRPIKIRSLLYVNDDNFVRTEGKYKKYYIYNIITSICQSNFR